MILYIMNLTGTAARHTLKTGFDSGKILCTFNEK